MRNILFCLIILSVSTHLFSQSVTNVRARQEDKKIVITYDLAGGAAGQSFIVKLLVSEDGGYSWKGPLQAVSGDVGTGVTEGFSRQLIWDLLSEPGREKLQGDRIAFKIRAEFTQRSTEQQSTITGGLSGKPCPGMLTMTDPRDGQLYPTVQIGTQCWLQKNMNYQTGNSWCYGNNSSNCDTYGRLYDWKTALGVCPSGWHLPSDEEWTKMTEFLGGSDVAGGKMKESKTTHWASPNTGATNSSGFTALPGGGRGNNGGFGGLTSNASFWSSNEGSSAGTWYRYLYYDGANVGWQFYYYETYGCSARCLQD